MSLVALIRNLVGSKLPLCGYDSLPRFMLMSSSTSANDAKNNSSSVTKLGDEVNNKASPEQLDYVANQLVKHVPKFFRQPHPFALYTNDLVFINNIKSTRVQGVTQYAMQLALIKLYYNFRYTSIKVETLNLVKDPEDSYIKIRWRIVSRPGLFRMIATFYKIKPVEIWSDGLSTIHVNKKGLIYCHVCDNIDLERDELKMKKAVKSPLVSRGLNV